MPNTRLCPNCKTPTMMPISRRLQIYNSVICYKCSKCEKDVELIPLASIGVLLVVGLLALGFWGMILFSGPGQPGTISLIIFASASLSLFGTTAAQALKHRRYPVSRNNASPPISLEISSGSHVAKRAILWVEKLGFVAGMLAPIIFIALILGIAAIIGYINFTYFE